MKSKKLLRQAIKTARATYTRIRLNRWNTKKNPVPEVKADEPRRIRDHRNACLTAYDAKRILVENKGRNTTEGIPCY